MKMDMLNYDFYDAEYRSALRSISMMHDFITGCYSVNSYSYDEIDQLPIDENDKKNIKDVLSHSTKHRKIMYIGKNEKGYVFQNFIS